jgi:DNA repair protein RAD7
LRAEDYKQIFAVVQSLKLLVLHNAYQFKDESMDYMMEKALHLVDLRLYAANLVNNEKWSQFFRSRGFNLHTIKLRWMDAAFEDNQVSDMVKYCPNLTRLKLENIWKIGTDSIKTISKMKRLEHLSLSMHQPDSIPNNLLISLIKAVGPKLRTLSLRGFTNLDDEVLSQIHSSCQHLTKLRLTNNTEVTDAGFTSLFTNWANPPLHFVDLSGTRDIDNQNPDGPSDEPLGLAAEGFAALMHHSSLKLRRLDISACRHITLQALLDVFTSQGTSFPLLERVDMSFVRDVDDVVLAGLFRAAKSSLKRVELFGCFSVGGGVVVPSGVVIVGAPRLELMNDGGGGGMEVYGNGTEVYGMGAEEWDNEVPESIRKQMEDELDSFISDD